MQSRLRARKAPADSGNANNRLDQLAMNLSLVPFKPLIAGRNNRGILVPRR